MEQIPPEFAIQLLDQDYPDPVVRGFAVGRLEGLSDKELSHYLLQLVQALKWEPFHDSALSRFLLRRAVNNASLIGHPLIWMLKGEM